MDRTFVFPTLSFFFKTLESEEIRESFTVQPKDVLDSSTEDTSTQMKDVLAGLGTQMEDGYSPIFFLQQFALLLLLSINIIRSF